MSDNATPKKVGEVFKVLGGGTPATANPDFWKGPIPWATSADLDDDLGITPRKAISRAAIQSSATNLVPAGSVVVATRVGLGKVGIAPTDLCFSQDCQGLILNPDSCDSKFAALQLKLRVQIFKHISRGTTIAGVTKKQLLDVNFDLPPIKQQRRIVAEIEKQFTRLEAGVAALRRVQANLKRYRAAVLKAACEGKLVPTDAELTAKNAKSTKGKTNSASALSAVKTPGYETGAELLTRILAERQKNWTGRGKYKEPAAPGTANLPPLPEGWTWTNLDAAIVEGPQNGVYLPRELYGNGHAILRIDDYQDGWIRGVDELNKVAADEITAAKYQLRSGDVVINRVNSLTHLGKCLVVRETHERVLFESNMMKAQFASCVNPRYVEFYLRSRAGRTRLIHGAKWAVNQASINQEDVKRTPLPLPPLAEQTRIVAEVERRLSVVEELESVVSANLQRATRLRQSILQKAFIGKLCD